MGIQRPDVVTRISPTAGASIKPTRFFYSGWRRDARHGSIFKRFAPLLLLWLIVVVVGCSGTSTALVDDDGSEAKVNSQAMALYESVLAVYDDRDLEVDLASEETLLVSSPFVAVDDDHRRRVITRVLTMGGNVALNVVVEYQGRDREGDWESVSTEAPWAQRAAEEELELGRAVERHFHRHQRRRR